MSLSTEVEDFEGESHVAFARTVVREHSLVIEYCVSCNYLNLVLKLLDELLGGWAPRFKSVELLPSAWGVFEVTLDGELIYSKWARDRHAKEGEIAKLVKRRLGPSFEFTDHAPEVVDADGFPVGHADPKR